MGSNIDRAVLVWMTRFWPGLEAENVALRQ
jgi:hypothetical protein